MALPPLLRYVYNTGTDEVIRRGKRIFLTGGAELVHADPLLKTAVFQVKSDTHANSYRVLISKYNEPNGVSVRCQCPYNLGEICRHEAAALFQLQDLIDKNFLAEPEAHYDQRHTVVKMKNIDLKALRLLSSQEIFMEAENIARHHQAAIQRAADESVEALLQYGGEDFPLTIRRNEDRSFDTRCICDETAHPLCKHKTALFLQLLNAYGPQYFDTLRNWDREKNKLLAQYGYSLSDDLEGKFTFTYENGKPFLRVLDTSIRKLSQAGVSPETATLESGFPGEGGTDGGDRDGGDSARGPQSSRGLGVVFSRNPKEYPFLTLGLVQGEVNAQKDGFVSYLKKIELNRYVDYYLYPYSARDLITQMRKLQPAELNKYLSRNSPFAALWDQFYVEDGEKLPEETRKLILEFMHTRLKQLFPLIAGQPLNFWLPPAQALKSTSLVPVRISERQARPAFSVVSSPGGMRLHCLVSLGDETFPIEENETGSPLVFLRERVLYLFEGKNDPFVIDEYMQPGGKEISADEWPAYLEERLLPLSREYRVHFEDDLFREKSGIQPRCCIRVSELGDLLLIHPQFFYLDQEAGWDDQPTITTQRDGKILVIHRDQAAEQAFIDRLSGLHPSFKNPTHHRYFYLRTKEVIRKNWLFNFIDSLKEWNVVITGYDNLKNFRFNQHRPETRLNISSEIDWFDARVEISYGDQPVSVRAIKKALADKQHYVELPDGTLGLLPEQWLERYGLLFRMGEESAKGLRVSKFNFSVIDELYDHIDDQRILEELEEKKKNLLQTDQSVHTTLPSNIKAIMRSYQESGFQWLSYLDKVGWGGILADDMGLGKTLQALSFLQSVKNRRGDCLALVVCPTTLIYNWENEICKFTPELTYLIHHGPARTRMPEELTAKNIVITTYGTLRSDIQILMQAAFDYVILDESQAIKNPQSKIAKATHLLQTRNRLCLSGTPMQNNTLDIYAQMNFLNPGMLGSFDFFRNEFANPIDKLGDEDRKAHLRKLIYPFILRRTKEQVARDLPEKSEMVLFCEMDPEQRHIYESFRNMYRSKILGTIDEQGMGRSQLTILQGLMKLRQICDSPAILGEEEPYPNHSVKLHELMRELQENTGDHKVLVFSQFLGMLALIREKLKKQNIPFEYFDGSTSAADREQAIRNFQQNDPCRVFLISLKAGGVGLNLTAADYVYIVDPWWNPAVEQQAIDRTHRIGQTKNIFAYRMICKNTVEEKILQLQEKKKSLVKDIISDDSGFIKKLTRDDIEYLFS